MIRCVKLWTGKDRGSRFQDGLIELEPGLRGDALSANVPISSAYFMKQSRSRNSDGIRIPLANSSSR